MQNQEISYDHQTSIEGCQEIYCKQGGLLACDTFEDSAMTLEEETDMNTSISQHQRTMMDNTGIHSFAKREDD